MRSPTAADGERRLQHRAPHPARELAAYQRQFRRLAAHPAVERRTVGELSGHPYEVFRIRATKPGAVRVLITASNHGNERVGPPAALRWARSLLERPDLRERVDVTIVPFLNPAGFAADSRFTAEGLDPNRQFHPSSDVPVARLLREAIGDDRFELAVDLHSAHSVRDGFFLIGEADPGGQLLEGAHALAAAAVSRLEDRVVFSCSERPPYRRVERGVYTSSNVGTQKSFMASRGTRDTFTVEAPRTFGYRDQVEGTMRIVSELVDGVIEAKA